MTVREKAEHSIGRKYGLYTVMKIERRPNKQGQLYAWADAKCDCGKIKWVRLQCLKAGTTVSCGCHALKIKKQQKGVKSSKYKHGHYIDKKVSLTMSTWRAMLNRCARPTNNRYYLYGAKGIRVCERWHTFESFVADMGERPTKNHTIDRIDNSKGYEPGNCRWATKSEQAANRKTTKFFTIDGETKCLKHWAKQYGLPYVLVYKRIFYKKWDVKKALTEPLKNTK